MSFNLVILAFLAISTLAKSEKFLTINDCDRNARNGSIPMDCKCPPNFALLVNEDICVLLTEPRAWSEDYCVKFGTVDDFYHLGDKEIAAVRELILKNPSEFWISVRKDGLYGLPLSRLPGRGWGTVPDLKDIGISQAESSGNCLKVNVINSTSAKGRFVDCSEKHPQLCIYKPKNSLLRLYCEDPDELTTRYSLYQDTCFKIESNYSNRTKMVQFIAKNDRKFEIFDRIQTQTSYQCSTILYNNGSTYSHVSSKNYSSLANISSTCVAHQRKEKIFKPKLNLNYDRVVQKLLLSITDSRFLWRESPLDPGFTCFTGTDLQFRTNVTIKQKLWPPANATASHDDDAEIYELSIRNTFPSLYWCEGHAVPNFTLVRSQKVVEQWKEPDLHIFAVWILVQNESFQEHLEMVIVILHSIFWRTGNVIYARLAKIESTEDNKLKVLLQIAAENSVQNASNIGQSSGIPSELLDGIRDHYQLMLDVETSIKKELTMFGDHNLKFLGINSTEMCLPVESDRKGVWWPAAPIGQSVVLKQKDLCLLKSGMLPYRKCLGDRINGGFWESVTQDLNQCLEPANAQTKALVSYYTNSSNMKIDKIEGALEGINDVIRVHTKEMTAVDVFHVASTIENFRKTLLDNGTVIANESTSFYCGLSAVLSNMMDVKESVMSDSQSQLNATNRLLESTEDIINQLATSSAESVRIGAGRNCSDDPRGIVSGRGTMLLRKPKFILLVADPGEANITGLALIRKGSSVDDDFDSYDLRLLTMDDSEEDTLAMDNLEIASFVPRTLVGKMKQLRSEISTGTETPDILFRVVISVYFNDHIFLESFGESSRRTNGKIISVTVPGYGSELPEKLPIYVRDREPIKNSSCEFWKFIRNDGDNGSRWSSIGCELSGKLDNVNLCRCTHMTSFSRIFLDHYGAEKLVTEHPHSALALDIITLVGCALSLLGIIGIFTTAIVFPRWNDQFNSKILLHLSFAVAIELIVFSFIGHTKRAKPDTWCKVQGALIHYSILVTFMWMLVIAHLQFMRFVKVLGKLRPTHCVLKATILSWGLPLAPVAFFFYTKRGLYTPPIGNSSDICYPHGDAQYYGLIAPIVLILTANVVCFLFILYHVTRTPDNLVRSTDKSMTLLQLRLFVLLFFQLGLSWIFGIMVAESEYLVWSYLFCFTAPYQGLMLFIICVLLQPSARRLWSKKFSEMFSKNYNQISLSSSQPPLWL